MELLTQLGSFCFDSLSVFHADEKFWENLLDSAARPAKTEDMNNTTKELENELVWSLKTFGRLYDQQVQLLHTASDGLEQVAASFGHSFRFTMVEAGKTLGYLLGGFSGGIYGTISALVWSEGHAEDVTFGFLGSILGGVAGGALGGAISSLVTILSNLAGVPVGDGTSGRAWLFGFAAGGVAGGAIGGPLGAKGGALGGALGAFFALQCARDVMIFVRHVLERLKGMETPLTKPVSDGLSHCLGDFRECAKPLLPQLKHIQIICKKMASHHHHVHAVATQTAASLDALAKMEAVARRTSCLLELVVGVLAAAQLSRRFNTELEGLRRSVETFPHQLSGIPL